MSNQAATNSHVVVAVKNDLLRLLQAANISTSDDERQHPIFAGVVVCVSGIDDIDRRVEINKLVNAHGGSFRKELQRPVDVTHLLCSGDVSEPTDKMHYAERFNQRGETDIKLVWEEWFWDCLEFGGHFDEEKYLVKSHPRPERRRRPVEAPPQPSVPDTNTPHESQVGASRRASTSRLSTTNGVYTNNGVRKTTRTTTPNLRTRKPGASTPTLPRCASGRVS